MRFKLQLVSSNRYLNAKILIDPMSMKTQIKGHSAGLTRDPSPGLLDSNPLLARSKSRTICLRSQGRMVSQNKGLNPESSVFQADISHMVDLAVPYKQAKTSKAITWQTFRQHKLQRETRLDHQLKLEGEDSVPAKRLTLQLLLWLIPTNKWMNCLELRIKTRSLILARLRQHQRNLPILPSRGASAWVTTMNTLHDFRLQTAQVTNRRTVSLMSISRQDLPAIIPALTPVIESQNANIVSNWKNASLKPNRLRNQKRVSMTQDLQFIYCSKRLQESK